MRRSHLRQRMRQQPALAKYLATRQLLQTPTMKAMRFLQTLGLISQHSHSRDRGVRSLRSTLMDHQVSPEMEETLTREGDLKPDVSQNASLDIDKSLKYRPTVQSEGIVGTSIELGIPPEETGPRMLERPDGFKTETQHERGEEIFATRESDRSPLAWLARLVEGARPQADAEPIKEPHNIGPPASTLRAAGAANPLARGSQHRSFRSLAQVEQPRTLSQATRRFLKPLVGIDPANVSVYAGSSAAKLVSRNQADALTVSEVVALGPGHTSESPEQLGVLAHELTHVVRQRQPRFVPPLARQAPGQSVATVTLETMDEEALARRVESRVIRAAKADENRASSPEPMTTVSTKSFFAPDAIEPLPSESSAAAPDWGGLPAPWEPLPEWISAPAGESVPSAPAAVTTNAADISLADASYGVSSGRVHFAEQGRSLEEDPQSAYGVHEVRAAESAKQVAPDLDAMAQQVYSILKRRLAVERRRESF